MLVDYFELMAIQAGSAGFTLVVRSNPDSQYASRSRATWTGACKSRGTAVAA
jgi:hypothetical protein